MTEGPVISVHPETSLIDEDQIISVHGLTKYQYIGIHVRTSVESGAQYASLGCYRADDHGVVNVSKDESIQGTYTGVDPMGLFWSLEAEPGFENRRFMKTNVLTPIVYNIFVYEGIHTLDEIQNCPKAAVLTKTIHRFYKRENVRRVKMKEGMVVGTIFIPEGRGPFPAVIDMFGGIGGIVETRAALLASRGFLTLALPYLLYDDLPAGKHMFGDYTYFKKNVEWLSNHPLAVKGDIGLVGVSAGGFVANFLTLMYKEVKACVIINSGLYYPIRAVYMNEFYKVPVTLEVDPSKFVETSEGMDTTKMYTYYQERVSKSWLSNSKYLCIIGADDRCVDPAYIEDWYANWPADQKRWVTVLKYQDAGHLIEPPYTPLNRVSFSKDLNAYQLWGGKPRAHAYSQKDSWTKMLSFLRENLTQQQSVKSNL